MDRQFGKAFADTVESTGDIGITVLILSFLKDLLLASSLKSIWTLINILQFIVFFTEIKTVKLSTAANNFILALRKLALGEFIPYDWFNIKMKDFFESNLQEEPSDEEDYIDSLVSMLMVAFGILLFTLLIVLLGCCCRKISRKHSNTLETVKKKLFWNAFIRYSITSYLKYSVANSIGLLTIE